MRLTVIVFAVLTLSYFVATVFGRVCRWADGEPLPARRWHMGALLALIVAAAALSIAGCGGSSGTPSSIPAAPPPASSAGSSGSSTPPPPAQCPPGAVGRPPNCTGSSPPPPLPVCPVGSTGLFATVCQCPSGDANGSTCVVPPPQCPAGDTGTPPVCVAPAPPAATATLTLAPAAGMPGYTLTWASVNASGCSLGPSGGLTAVALEGSQTVAPAADTAYVLVCGGAGGNAELSVTVPGSAPTCPAGDTGTYPDCTAPPPTCPPPAVLIGGTCQAPPSVSVQLSIAPAAVVDDSLGCPDPAGDVCSAVVTLTAASSLAGDSLLCYPAGSQDALNPAIGYSVGPFPASQDGPQVVTVTCRDVYFSSATASVTLDVIPPSGPTQPDTLTAAANSDGSYTFTWATWSAQGAGGCSVMLSSSTGTGPYGSQTALEPGGTSQGSAVTAFLSPAYGPYTAVLYCSGAPDAGVPAVTVSP